MLECGKGMNGGLAAISEGSTTSGIINGLKLCRKVYNKEWNRIKTVYIIKQKCLACFFDLNMSFADDFEEEKILEKSVNNNRKNGEIGGGIEFKYVYYEIPCSSKYHRKFNNKAWIEFLTDINKYEAIIALQPQTPQWISSTNHFTKTKTKQIQTLLKDVTTKLRYLEIEREKPLPKAKVKVVEVSESCKSQGSVKQQQQQKPLGADVNINAKPAVIEGYRKQPKAVMVRTVGTLNTYKLKWRNSSSPDKTDSGA